MATFVESGMTFDFPDESLYHVETSPLYAQVENFSTCECVVKLNGKVTLIEAKSSTPNPLNKEKFDDFVEDIASKFRDTMTFYHAALLRHDEEPIGTELVDIEHKEVEYQFVLIIHGHKEEWLPPVMDALKGRVKHVLRLWRIKETSVKVINETIAKDWNMITDF
ncbi:MAG: hypothetical protein NC344_04165 [Bacteroidales bacterium]|nr:hypothetical protein [Bacteroidales bacterium]MCM1147023.1 hypothetical protein [Bacteroidales bacterium]MCM1205844.1 hypothetical protein [Bacillota bacterium]MCM1509915.1 hypothetical protein [Clostridium sp.]